MKKVILLCIYVLEKLANFIILKRRHVEYDNSLKINGILSVYGHGKICIGKGSRINSKESANPGLGGNPKTVLSVPTGELYIGSNVGISNVAITCVNKITIEDDVLLGNGVMIYDTDFHSLDYRLRGKGPQIDFPVSKPILIKKNAFVGAHTIVLKGVTIGERVIVGAGSVVTKDIPKDEIWAGSPAKKIGNIED